MIKDKNSSKVGRHKKKKKEKNKEASFGEEEEQGRERKKKEIAAEDEEEGRGSEPRDTARATKLGEGPTIHESSVRFLTVGCPNRDFQSEPRYGTEGTRTLLGFYHYSAFRPSLLLDPTDYERIDCRTGY
ncbi:hypothetical protein AVEN_230233-1 [Araneus ventricosus]|uniref:Uncharacterized protein n=1 Tax=Araneus ventricosus TaxID=182803 RepID=A0A4Y2DYB8_ARAVE|nr:hypothetical protein AVEN_230233-1 [Araneus ventricosus]